jgi:hypothetical protein
MRHATIALCVLALGLTGCMSSGREVTYQEAAQFQKGVTTESEVIARLGQPNSIARLGDGTTIIVYAHIEASPDAVDYVPVVGLFAGGASAHSTTVTFTFGTDGRLRDYTSATANSVVHSGLAK